MSWGLLPELWQGELGIAARVVAKDLQPKSVYDGRVQRISDGDKNCYKGSHRNLGNCSKVSLMGPQLCRHY